MLKKILSLTVGLLWLAASSYAYPVITNQGATFQVANDPSTGTVVNKLVSYSSANPARAIVASAGTTSGILGIATQGAGTTGSVLIQNSGFANCNFDNAPTAGDSVVPSPSVAGECHDTGGTSTNGSIGQVSTTGVVPGVYSILLYAAATSTSFTQQPINAGPAQTGNYNAQGFQINNLAAPTTTGDALSQGHVASVTNLTASGTVSLTDTSGNGSSITSGLCADGICPGTAFGMAVANSNNASNLQAAINAAYETGTTSATKGRVLITPDSTGGTTYNFSSGVDFKAVPVECVAGRNSGNSAGLFNITLNFTATTGIFLKNVLPGFKNCRVTGAFTVGNGLQNTITSITDGANGQATVVTASANTVIAGSTVVISGSTNYNFPFPVASVTNNTTFVIDTGRIGTATETSGTCSGGLACINYYPTVGVMASANSSILSANALDWENLFVQGFGTDYSLSSVQTTSGSVNNWHTKALYAGNAIVGVIASGNGFPLAGSNSNVSGGTLEGLQCVSTAVCVYGGPMVNTTSNISDVEETSFSDNFVGGLDFETADLNSADSGLVAGIWVGGYGNKIGGINYISAGQSAGVGQTAKGQIRTADGQGPNFIEQNRVGSVATGLVLNTSNDVAEQNTPGISFNQRFSETSIGGPTFKPLGQTPNAISASCTGSCATAGGGGIIHIYALVGIGKDGNRSTVSPQFICPDGITFEASGGKASCPAGNLGPTSFSGSNFMTICHTNNLGFQAYDLLIDDTSHSARVNFGSGANGNNCIPDTAGTTTSYSLAPAADTTGGITETNATTVNTIGPIVGNGTPGIAGGGSLGLNANSSFGIMTGLAATNNVLTPGYICPHNVVAVFQDDTTAGGIKVTARSATSITFSATGSDVGEYWAGCI